MTQQNWPFENSIIGVCSGEEINDASDDDDPKDDGDVDVDAVLYIVEGRQLGYGTKLAWEVANYGGLRCPSEVLSLRWQDIDWERQRINVPSPKTEHHGKGSRLIPLFPELKVALEEAWELAPEGAIYVVDERYRKSSNASKGWRNCNLRTYFERIITRAGLEPWPKLFHALRSSRETELAQDFPIHVVTAWLGNTPTIAMRHYLLTTDADFERAAGGKTRTEKAVQIPVQQAPETGCNGEQPESANRDFPRENETLHHGATSKNGEDRNRTF